MMQFCTGPLVYIALMRYNSFMEFKEKLIAVRRALGLSQTDMAKRLGVSFSTVNRLENGHFGPNYETAAKVNALYEEIVAGNQTNAMPAFLVAKSGDVFADVSAIVEASKRDAVRAINIALLRRNHLIGKRIDEEIISTRANDYGKSIIKKLSAFLTERFGSGFDESNLYSFVRFYRYFPNIFDSLSPKSFLSWTHYRVLIRVDSDVARPYYEKEALASGWSVRDLQRAIHSQYYERLLSTQSGGLPALPQGIAPSKDPLEYVKNPFVAEFLGLPNPERPDETELRNEVERQKAIFLLTRKDEND